MEHSPENGKNPRQGKQTTQILDLLLETEESKTNPDVDQKLKQVGISRQRRSRNINLDLFKVLD